MTNLPLPIVRPGHGKRMEVQLLCIICYDCAFYVVKKWPFI